MERHQLAAQQADRESAERWEQTARLVNMVLPVGWLPLGVMSAAEGRVLPSILGLLGMTLIGTASLWRAYRTTIGLYQGQPTNRKGRPTTRRAHAGERPEAGRPAARGPSPRLVGTGLGHRAGGLSLARAVARGEDDVADPGDHEPHLRLDAPRSGVTILPESFRPLVAIGGMGVVLLGVLQLMGNQFGFDRDGFRVFVLCAAPRRDILLGKNLAFAPLALGMAAILLAIVQIVCPMRPDHFLAMFPQYVSMFLLFCICTNLLSIYAPVHIAAGSLKPSNPKLSTVLLQLVMFLFLFPLTQGATLLPLGIEALLRFQGLGTGVPICLLLSLVGMRRDRRHLPLLVGLARGPAPSPRAENPGNRDEPIALTRTPSNSAPPRLTVRQRPATTMPHHLPPAQPAVPDPRELPDSP